jgi:hypothetical protein
MMAGLVPLRKTLADDADPAVRLAAGESIVTIAGGAACALIAARAGAGAGAGTDPDPAVRDGLRRALAGLPPPGCARMPPSDRR